MEYRRLEFDLVFHFKMVCNFPHILKLFSAIFERITEIEAEFLLGRKTYTISNIFNIRSLSYYAMRIWNILATNITKWDRTEDFMKCLKRFEVHLIPYLSFKNLIADLILVMIVLHSLFDIFIFEFLCHQMCTFFFFFFFSSFLLKVSLYVFCASHI